MVKKNQIMITALAIMIAVAGYLNFAGEQITDEEIMSVTADNAVSSVKEDTYIDDTEVATLFEISDEDMEQAENGDIESLDTEVITEQENYMEETMEEMLGGYTDEQLSESGTPGEAVFTSSTSLDVSSGAKLLKEQTRAKNKETLLEIINNENITEEQKQAAIDNMITITDVAEKEMAAEILLEAKGFADVVVSITDGSVDVVVNAPELSEAQRAQIEDIVVRKTGIAPENIVISTITEQ